ncbi:unnamed protein product [Tetraodon nigroviridis]|uniref:RING-type E3 ubiquitin transferase n=1 Tax=Tetraodon nigroviridis TaxID=99883 RepID=Q4RV85_TETNG|nr:unnamed protein product [Tetraodon nigroviridis]
MEMIHEKFHQVSSGLVDIVGQYLSGEKPKGQLETEEMLKVGAALIGAGELVLAADGTLSLQPPSDGSEYFLSLVDFDSLQGELKSAAYWCQWLAVASALLGTAVLVWVCRRYYCHRKAQRQLEEERRIFERMSEEPRVRASPQASVNLVEEQVENICVICYTEPRNCIIMDCGHVCCCYSCYQALVQRKCPICRQDISRVLPLHFV